MPEAYSETEAPNADPSIDTPGRDLPVTSRVMHPVGPMAESGLPSLEKVTTRLKPSGRGRPAGA